MKKNTIEYSFSLLLCWLLICMLLCGCEGQHGDVTTAPHTDPTPAVTAEVTTEEKTYPETTEVSPVTTEPPATDPPAPETAEVFVHGYGGYTKKYTVEIGKTLSDAALEAAQLPPQMADVKVRLIGWEYSIEENGTRMPYDTTDPSPVSENGMHLYQIFDYSFCVRFSAGIGEFPSGTETFFYFPSGSLIKPSELLYDMPAKAADDDFEYIFLGFMYDGKGYRIDDEIKITEPTELVAVFDKREIEYSVIAHTEYGELLSGGKTFVFKGTLEEAEKFVSSYDEYSAERITVEGKPYRFVRVDVTKEGREWTLELIWEPERPFTVEFNAGEGFFDDGSKKVVLSGYRGDALIPPTPSMPSRGDVEFIFDGWDGEFADIISGDAVYTAVYKTPKPVYYLNYYINGEFIESAPYYAGTKIPIPDRPEAAKGKIFSGWRGLPELMPDSDTDVNAEIRSAVVVYRIDGEVVSRTETPVGTLVTLSAPALKYGYTVSGWTTTDIESLKDGAFTMPERDVFFDAVSTPKVHQIIYILDGKEIYVDRVIFGDIYTVRGIEVKRGCEFTGWTPHGVNINITNGSFRVPDADIVLTGRFEIRSYTVNYYLDDMLLYSDVYRYGDLVVLRPNEEQEGCTFTWTSAGANLSDGSFVMPAGDVDIYGAFSDGDNRVVFVIDGEEYGVLGVAAGRTLDIPIWPTKHGFSFSGWQCDEIDVSTGEFIMPDGEIIIYGSFIPNAHTVSFIDMATGSVAGTSYLDFDARFSFADDMFCEEGRVSVGMVLLAGDVIRDGEEYIMPDSDVLFGVLWEECLTLMLDENYHIPYFALIFEEYEGCRYDETTKTLYISDPAITTSGPSDGINIVFEY